MQKSYTILVLISRFEEYRFDNHSIVPNALFRMGHKVIIGDIETISFKDGKVRCKLFALQQEYQDGVPFPQLDLRMDSAEDGIDLVWVLSNPHPNLLLDTYLLLWVLNERKPFVNAAAATLFLNAKTTLPSTIEADHLPDTLTSSSFDEIYSAIEAEPNKKWVVKPTNEGCGADVFFLSHNDSNTRALLQSCTGNEVPKYEMYGRQTVGLSRRYATMQSYVENVHENEKRVLLSGGVPVCGFRRFIDPNDHRGNVTLGTKFEGLDLTEDENQFCLRLGENLMRKGIYFVGVDMAYPYVFELNIANPGALNYSFRATGIDQSEEAMQHLLSALVGAGVLHQAQTESA